MGIRSIITALAEEVMPLVISRCHELGEHVDDHQLQITEKLADLGMIRVFHSLDELELLLAVDEQEGVDYAFQNRPLLDDIQVTVEEWLS